MHGAVVYSECESRTTDPHSAPPILIPPAYLSRTACAGTSFAILGFAAPPAPRCGPRGVTYDARMAFRRLAQRRRPGAMARPGPRVVAWRRPSGRAVARRFGRRCLARRRALRGLAGSLRGPRILDVQAGRRRRVTATK